MNSTTNQHKPLRTRSLVLAAMIAALSAGVSANPIDQQPPVSSGIPGHIGQMLDRLNLSEAQQQQIRTILDQERQAIDQQRQQTRERIDAVLTQEQRAERDRLLAEGMDRRVGQLAKRLDLTTDQQAQLRTIMTEKRDNPSMTRDEVRQRMAAVLTEQQMSELKEMRDKHSWLPRKEQGQQPN
jgi:protein CpxP